MPKVSYSEEDRERIRQELLTTALNLMARQGIQHTTVEQIYNRSVCPGPSFIPSFLPRRTSL